MSDRKSVLIIGLEPTLIDFSSPDYSIFPGMDAAKVWAGLKAAQDSLVRLGYDVQMCLTDYGLTAESVVLDALKHKHFDCIMIGAAVRMVAGNTVLFEKLVNIVHDHAPHARLCFNTKPTDTAEAVQRWLKT